jgi:hypothetical protein
VRHPRGTFRLIVPDQQSLDIWDDRHLVGHYSSSCRGEGELMLDGIMFCWCFWVVAGLNGYTSINGVGV